MKGAARCGLSIKSKGGHTSAPPVKTPVAALARAVTRVEKHPFPAVLTPAARDMFNILGRRSSFGMKLIFANLWLFLPLLKKICTASGGEMNALMRTTCCFTKMEGSQAANAIPTEARMTANLRLVRGNSMDDCEAYLRRVIDDPDITVTRIQGERRLAVLSGGRPGLGAGALRHRRNLARGGNGALYDDGLQRFPALLPHQRACAAFFRHGAFQGRARPDPRLERARSRRKGGPGGGVLYRVLKSAEPSGGQPSVCRKRPEAARLRFPIRYTWPCARYC